MKRVKNAGSGSIDSAMGAVVGSLIGDALGLGCHWYYDLDSMKADCGEWISDYMDPSPDRQDEFAKVSKYRYDAGLRAGDFSQTGEVALSLLESLADKGIYDEDDFTSRLDALLGSLDGTPFSGRYTDWAIRDIWKQRRSGLSWEQAGSTADTTEAAMRSVMLAAGFFNESEYLVETARRNIRLTHGDSYIAAQSLAFTLTVSGLIQTPLERIQKYLVSLYAKDPVRRFIPSFDCLVQVSNGSRAASAPVQIEPASLICSLYGLPCAMGFVLPSAYYLVHRYPASFESAVLSAVNGGGNNMARASLTGALSGALVGFSAIPERFISGLRERDRILDAAGQAIERVSSPG